MSDFRFSGFDSYHEQPVVLVVDDQPINIQLIYQILGNDYKILMATSGMQAIKICNDSLPDLVLMDVMMPEINGLETCKLMKAQEAIADIPVIFVTGLQQQEDENACWQAGAVDFIQKPVNANTLRNRVKAHITMKKQSDMLRAMAYIDGLTGVFNRRYFDSFLQRQIAVCRRREDSLAVLLMDIDHFKLYNDHLGHLQGDDALRKVAQALHQCCLRPTDLVARYGGEEFVAVLPHTDAAGAAIVAQKVLRAIAQLALPHPAVTNKIVSLSIGIAVACPDNEYAGDITARADAQLYLTKQHGRNGYTFDNVTQQAPDMPR